MSRQTIAVSVKASKLTARALAYVVAAVGRKIAKEHRKAQTPHGKQSVRKLMGHGGDTHAIEVDTPKLFDKVARKWGVDYAIRRVGDEKYLLLFKARQADAITGCFAEYSRLELKRAKSRQTIAVSVKASKLTARALAYVVAAVGRKIAKEHRKAQTPHGKQSVRKLMGHGGDINAIEVDTPKLFDKVARKWGVDYAIRRVGDEKYLLLFKARQADAITGCFAEYSRLELKRAKSQQTPIREQLRQAEEQVKKQPQRELTKEAAHGDR